MIESIVPMVVMTGMFAMIFGIVYLKSRENLALIEKGMNPKQNKASPKPFLNLKWGLLLIGNPARPAASRLKTRAGEAFRPRDG